MNLKEFLIAIGVATLLAIGGWVVVLVRVDPETAGLPGVVLFYLTAFAAIVGICAFLGTWLRARKEQHPHLIVREVKIALRHSIFLATLGLGALALASMNALRWWIWLIALVVICAVEYIFLLIQDQRRS